MMVNNVRVEDTPLEVFSFHFTKLIITAASYEWALTAVRAINHAQYSAIVEKLELNQEISEVDYFFSPRIGIDGRVKHTQTPDNRPGIAVLIGGYDLETTKMELLKRLYAINCPTISIFDGFSKESDPEDTISVQALVQILSGDRAIKAKIGETIIWSIPTSEGMSCRVQPEFKVRPGFIGASLLICGTAQKDTLKATMSAIDAIQDFENVICPYPAGIARLGTRFGSAQFYPTLREKVPESKVPKGVKSIYEIEIDGIALELIKEAIRAGIQKACKGNGIKRILTRERIGNFNGTEISFQEILE